MSKEDEVNMLIANLNDDAASATHACRELKELLENGSYTAHHRAIKDALEDAYEAWGDRNCNNWLDEDD